MSSKRSHEGEILIDHRYSPGLSEEMVHTAGGIPRVDAALPPGAGKGVFEAPTFTCSHCPNIVVLNPNRQRARAYCRKCDHYLCDACGAKMAMDKVCLTQKQRMDELQESAILEEVRNG